MNSLPWIEQEFRDVAERGKALTNRPYQPYTGQRLAGFSPEQEQAFAASQGNFAAYQPIMQQATGLAGQAGTYAPGQAQQYMNPYAQALSQSYGQSQDTRDAQAAIRQNWGSYHPILEQGQVFTQQGATYDPNRVGQYVNPYAQNYAQSLGNLSQNTKNALEAARGSYSVYQPFLQEAQGLTGQSATYDPNKLQQFLSPYTKGVVDEIGRLGNQNFTQNILPQTMSAFTGAGTFGGRRSQQAATDAAREAQMSILGQQQGALQNAYNAAQGAYSDWANRGMSGAGQLGSLAQARQGMQLSDQTNLLRAAQIEDTAAQQSARAMQDAYAQAQNIYGDWGSRALQGGQQLGALGQARQGMAMRDVEALTGAGLAQQQAAQQAQQALYNAYAQGQGLYKDWTGQGLQAAQILGTLGGQRQTMANIDIENLAKIGEARQKMQQAGLTEAQNEFNVQRDYPTAQLDAYNALLRGSPLSSLITPTPQQAELPTYRPALSPMASALTGLGATYGGLAEANSPSGQNRYFNKGGLVDFKREFRGIE